MEAVFLKQDKARTVQTYRSYLMNIVLKKNSPPPKLIRQGKNPKNQKKGKRGKNKKTKNAARNQNVLGKHQHKILV